MRSGGLEVQNPLSLPPAEVPGPAVLRRPVPTPPLSPAKFEVRVRVHACACVRACVCACVRDTHL